jgi:hypothetical protein
MFTIAFKLHKTLFAALTRSSNKSSNLDSTDTLPATQKQALRQM